uniref:G-protein coupled receptors family 1 profile domain-containing protein n=1 Tax=Panagrolaimus sp. JU765 TaxID=591449 RepID=A0AC34QK90_9BILA
MLQEYYSEWLFSESWCKLWLALDVLFSTASIYNLLAISFDRYMAVRQPLKYRLISSNKMTKITILMVWIISSLIAFPPLIYGKILQEKPTENPRICTPMTSNSIYILFSALVSFILPTIFMIILNISIFQTVQGSRNPKLLPLSTQSSNGLISVYQLPNTILRVHRGGRNNSNSGQTIKNSNDTPPLTKHKTKNINRSPSLYIHHRKKEIEIDFEVGIQRKKSVSTPTLDLLANIENQKRESLQTIKKHNCVVKQATINLSQTSDEFHTIEEPPRLDSKIQFGNEFCGKFQSHMIQKTVQQTIWYPMVLTIFLAGKSSKPCNEQQTTPANQSNRFLLRTELRVARTIGIVVGCFTICWLPFTVIYLLQAFETCPIDTCVPGWLFTTAFWLGYANSAVNPMIYAIFSRDFRTAFRKVLTGNFRNRYNLSQRSL